MLTKISHVLLFLLCCTYTALAQNSCLPLTINTTMGTCINGGSVTIIPTAGTAPYGYSALPGAPGGFFQDSLTVIGLAAGTYAITINDSFNCITDTTFSIQGPTPLFVEFNLNAATCFNGADIEILVFEGLPPYSYDWGLGFPDTSFISDVPPGIYEVTVTDAAGCSESVSILVTDPEVPVIANALVQSVSCNGGSDGLIQVLVEGGTAPYSFEWSPQGSQGPVAGNLSAGNYCVTVTDGNACSAVTCFDVAEPGPIMLDIITTDSSNNNDGTITATVTGGTPPYAYQWSNGAVTATITGLGTGSYDVTITDSNGCNITAGPITINSSAFQVDVTDVICNGDMNGSIQIEMLSGTAPFTFSWTGPNGFSSMLEDIDNLAGGAYTIVATDAMGTTFTTTITVAEYAPIGVDVTNLTQCFGEPISIQLVAFGGLPPYSIEWEGGVDPNNLNPGTYEITVTDAATCVSVEVIVVTEPDPITVSYTVDAATCAGSADACINTMVTGGTPPYSYTWSDGQTGPDICNLAAGVYLLSVIDIFGCVVSIDIPVGEPSPIAINLMGTSIVCTNEGTIDALVTGGVPSYTYSWSDDPSVNVATRSGLGAGVYTLSVVDANNCLSVASYEIISSISLSLESTPAGCDSTGGTATATITGGANNPTYAWSTGATTSTISNLSPGGYSLTVSDIDNGCTRHDNVLVALDSSCFSIIAGTVYLEEVNQDCMPDPGALTVANILIQLDNGAATFTDSMGYYQFNVEPGIYSVSISANNPQYTALCGGPTSVDVSNPLDASYDNDFFVEYAIDRDLKVYVNKGNARPGFTQFIRICVWNYGAEPASGTLTFTHDPLQEFLSATPSETSYDLASSTIKWDFFNIPPGSFIVFRPKVKLPPSVPIGTAILLDFVADPIMGDLTPWDNVVHCPMTVTGSYDPNDKQVTPGGEGEQGNVYVTDTLLTYLIRFQNTGTDTAFTVVVKDTLEDMLDMETVVPGPSSHPYSLTVEDERVLVFTFDNIMLPDSFVNEPASNGWFFFDIRPIEGSGYGTVIENSAAIFFDFNPPIITNTVITTFTEPLSTHDPELIPLPLQIQPNPSSGEVILTYQLEDRQIVWINAYDMTGQLVARIQEPIAMTPGAQEVVIDAEILPAGVYLLQVETNAKLRGISKLIKLN